MGTNAARFQRTCQSVTASSSYLLRLHVRRSLHGRESNTLVIVVLIVVHERLCPHWAASWRLPQTPRPRKKRRGAGGRPYLPFASPMPAPSAPAFLPHRPICSARRPRLDGVPARHETSRRWNPSEVALFAAAARRARVTAAHAAGSRVRHSAACSLSVWLGRRRRHNTSAATRRCTSTCVLLPRQTRQRCRLPCAKS